MNPITKNFDRLLESLPAPYLGQELIGAGCSAVVVQSPFHPDRVVKLTCDPSSADFLTYLYRQEKPFRHLPKVYEVFETLPATRDSPPLCPVEMEKLTYRPISQKGPQAALHRSWVKTVQSDKDARCINPKYLHKSLRSPDVLSAMAAIEDFTLGKDACFDGDTFSNCMFRQNGDWVLVDPLVNTDCL